MESMEAQSSTLTEAQQKAVVHTTGPLLVLAGPGSGKTTVVTKRITNLIDTGVAPWQILALTFTNKAAQEMRDRVQVLLDERGVQARGLTVTTFHAFCARILREWGDRVIGTTTFTIYDTADQRSAAKQAIKACQMNESNFKPAGVLSVISNAKNKLIDADAFAKDASDFYAKSIAKIYKSYDSILRGNDAVDFDDLLMHTAKLLENHQEVREITGIYVSLVTLINRSMRGEALTYQTYLILKSTMVKAQLYRLAGTLGQLEISLKQLLHSLRIMCNAKIKNYSQNMKMVANQLWHHSKMNIVKPMQLSKK
jgi:ATP-dependent exoDNAse (exonuclease V) beta subunit